jgi:hypothetical protein
MCHNEHRRSRAISGEYIKKEMQTLYDIGQALAASPRWSEKYPHPKDLA